LLSLLSLLLLLLLLLSLTGRRTNAAVVVEVALANGNVIL